MPSAELVILPDVDRVKLNSTVAEMKLAYAQLAKYSGDELAAHLRRGAIVGAKSGADKAGRIMGDAMMKAAEKGKVAFGKMLNPTALAAAIGGALTLGIAGAQSRVDSAFGAMSGVGEMYLETRRQQATQRASGLDMGQYAQQRAMFQMQAGIDAEGYRGIIEGIRDTMTSDPNLFKNYRGLGAGEVLNNIIASNAGKETAFVQQQLQKAGLTGEDLSAAMQVARKAGAFETGAKSSDVLNKLTTMNKSEGEVIKETMTANLELQKSAQQLMKQQLESQRDIAKAIAAQGVGKYIEDQRHQTDKLTNAIAGIEENYRTMELARSATEKVQGSLIDATNSLTEAINTLISVFTSSAESVEAKQYDELTWVDKLLHPMAASKVIIDNVKAKIGEQNVKVDNSMKPNNANNGTGYGYNR